MSYNLTQDVADSFEFTLGGHKYIARYPTTEEVLEASKLAEDVDKQNAWLYGLITGDEGAPSIEEALQSTNIKVLENFRKMIITEFGVE